MNYKNEVEAKVIRIQKRISRILDEMFEARYKGKEQYFTSYYDSFDKAYDCLDEASYNLGCAITEIKKGNADDWE